MNEARYLIVNADDFGQSEGLTRGIIEAHEHGIVTSSSLMVRWPAAAGAAEYARSHPELSVGLHLDFGEWTYRNGSWSPIYEVVPIDDRPALEHEILRQWGEFQRLIGKPPTHLDSHQHFHLRDTVLPIVTRLGQQAGIPVRRANVKVRYCGEFYGQTAEGRPLPQAITVSALVRIIRSLPAGRTELGCHPSLDDDLRTMYRGERRAELQTLCDPAVRAAIESAGIRLCSFMEAP